MNVPSAVVIPAYNEERYIGEVIEAAQNADGSLVNTQDIFVVDNNSTDNTANIANYLGARVINCEPQGKAPAMATGVEAARQLGVRAITFLDADLINLKGRHVDQLTEPVVQGEAPMTIGYLGKRKDFTKRVIYQHWGMFTGIRSVDLEIWDSLCLRDLKGFRAEAALNSLFRHSGRGEEIRRLELEGVSHIGKFDKYSLLKGLWQYARIELSAIYGLSTRSSL